MAERRRTTLYRKNMIGGVIPRDEWDEIVLIMYRILDKIVTHHTADTLIIDNNALFVLKDRHVVSKLLFNRGYQPTTSLETALRVILRHDVIAASYIYLVKRTLQARIYKIK